MKFRTKKYHISFWIFQSEMWHQNPMCRSLTWSPHNGSAPWSYIPRSPVVNGIQIRNSLMTSVLPYCWSADTVSPVQSFDLLASGTLFVIFFYFFSYRAKVVESCSGTKMLLAHHLRTGGLKCPCFGKSRCLIIIFSMDFANVYHILNNVLIYHQVVLPIDEIG